MGFKFFNSLAPKRLLSFVSHDEKDSQKGVVTPPPEQAAPTAPAVVEGKRYHIEDKLKLVAPHHESFKQLWATKWKMPASMGIYPFMLGTAVDFEDIVDKMDKAGMKEPYDWDQYAGFFIPKAAELEAKAIEAEKNGEKAKASEYYQRSSVVYRHARMPTVRTPKQKQAWEKCKETVQKAFLLKGEVEGYDPIHEVLVPHTHALAHEGKEIPIFHQVPSSASAAEPAPLVVIVCGLDGYRTELAVWSEGWRRNGVAFACVEVPGTGDSPADAKDVTSPDRLFSSLLDWIEKQEKLDAKKVVVWGFSTGGYYAIRLAHTHHDRIAGAASIGGGCHHMFDEKWLNEVNHLEYPFDLADTLAWKFGYGHDVETFKKEASKFSLLNDGTLKQPKCARLLLVNGTEDEIYPVDDMYVALSYGAAKEARFVPGIKHMGEPESFFVIIPWIYSLFGRTGVNAGAQLKLNMFKPQFP